MATLLIAEHDNSELNEATSKALTAAKEMGGDIHVLVAGKGSGAVAEAASKLDGVSKVLHCDDAMFERPLAENMASSQCSTLETPSNLEAASAAAPEPEPATST